MTPWTSLADRIFKRETCEKLIKDQGRSFEFKGLGIEIPGFKLSFEGFSTEPRVLEKASKAAKALDDLQYQLCQDLSKKSVTEILDRDVLTRYTKARMSSLFLFSSFRAVLAAFEEDREGQRVNLEKSIEDIQRFTSSLTSEDLIAPQELSSRSRGAISTALKIAKVDEQELDSILLDKFVEFERTQREILERVKQVQETFETQVTEMRLSGASVELITASKQFNKGDPSFCWKNADFSNADIRNGYDARRPVTDDIIQSIEAHEATFVYGDPYVGKSILIKRVMFEMANSGYAVIYSIGVSTASNAYQIIDLLNSLSKKYPKILFIADDAHKTANESFFKIFNELYDMSPEKKIRFLFAAREKQLNKTNYDIERAFSSNKIRKDAEFRIGFSLDDALLFLQRAIEVTYEMKSAITDAIITPAADIAKNLYQKTQGDPFMFSLGIKYFLLGLENAREGRHQEPENVVSNEMTALIEKIDEIEEKEKIQNNELWKATITGTIMGIANITLDHKSHPKLFSCSKILPKPFWTLLQNNILLKESEEGQLRIKHEMFAYEFLSVFYENHFFNNLESFNEHYGYIVKCIWDSIKVEEIIDMLSSCTYLYGIDRYRPISELITSHYLVSPTQYSPPPGINDYDKAKLFCDGLGNFYLRQEEYENSLTCYDIALNIKPDYVEAWNNKGYVFDKLGMYEDALASYDEALKLNPTYTDVWYNKGLALFNLGIEKYKDSINCYDEALKLNPTYTDVWYNKGLALHYLGRYDEAIACYNEAIQIESNYANSWYNRACSNVRKGNIENGLADLKRAIEIDRECIESAIQDKDFEGIRNDERFNQIVRESNKD